MLHPSGSSTRMLLVRRCFVQWGTGGPSFTDLSGAVTAPWRLRTRSKGAYRLEVRPTFIEKTDLFAMKHDALDGKTPDRSGDRREGVCPVPPSLRLEVNRPTLTPGDDAIAVPLEFMNPFGPGRDLLRQHRLTGENEARRSAPIAGERATPLENHGGGYGWRAREMETRLSWESFR